MTNTPAPDAGHAAETMGNQRLVDAFIISVSAYTRNVPGSFDRCEELRKELLRRLNTAPARTAGTETGETK